MRAPARAPLLVVALAALAGIIDGNTSPAQPRYRRHQLTELLARADRIVSGTIVTVRAETFDLAVETTISGGGSSATLQVRRFDDWTCASRWTEYAAGQRVLLFLSGAETKKTPFRILGGGGEGEMPLIGDALVVRGYEVHGYDYQRHETLGAYCSGPLIPLAEFADAVTRFRTAFSWKQAAGGAFEWIDFRSEQEALLLRSSSRTGCHLFEQVVSSKEWRHPPVEQRLPAGLKRLEATPLHLSGPVRLGPGRTPDRFGFQLDSGFGMACAYLGDVNGDGVEDLGWALPATPTWGAFTVPSGSC